MDTGLPIMAAWATLGCTVTGTKTRLAFIGLQVVAEHRVGVAGLDPDDPGQGLDNLQVVEAQKPGHDGGDVAGVADGHHHDFFRQVVVERFGRSHRHMTPGPGCARSFWN